MVVRSSPSHLRLPGSPADGGQRHAVEDAISGALIAGRAVHGERRREEARQRDTVAPRLLEDGAQQLGGDAPRPMLRGHANGSDARAGDGPPAEPVPHRQGHEPSDDLRALPRDAHRRWVETPEKQRYAARGEA